jgi:hypothetical protein
VTQLLGPDRLVLLARIARAYVGTLVAFTVADEEVDVVGYEAARLAFEGAEAAWLGELARLATDETDQAAVLVLSAAPLAEEVRRLRRQASPRPRTSDIRLPHELRVMTRAIIAAADDVGYRYRVLHDSGFEALRSPAGGGGGHAPPHDDGCPRDLSDTAFGRVRDPEGEESEAELDARRPVTERVRDELARASAAVARADGDVRQAQNALVKAERLVDLSIPPRADWGTDRFRERDMTDRELLARLEVRLAHVKPRLVRELERDIDLLRKRIAAEEVREKREKLNGEARESRRARRPGPVNPYVVLPGP